jgi:hypothetical protein
MNKAAAMALLKRQSPKVRQAVEAVLRGVDPVACKMLGIETVLGWVADEVAGKPFAGVPKEAIAEYRINW